MDFSNFVFWMLVTTMEVLPSNSVLVSILGAMLPPNNIDDAR